MKQMASLQNFHGLSLLAFFTSTLASSLTLACFVATPEQTTQWQELVHRTGAIAIAEAVSADPGSAAVSSGATTAAGATATVSAPDAAVPSPATKMKFQVVAMLKGHVGPAIEMDDVIALPKPDPKNTDKSFDAQTASFNDHHDKAFWKKGVGRTTPGPDCQIKPSFVVGQRYLVFQDKPYHVKSFELIRNDNDEWLRKVKAEIKKSAKNEVH